MNGCFYCGGRPAHYTVTVGNKEYPCCRHCAEVEAPKDKFPTKGK